jgi:hypothetical protein
MVRGLLAAVGIVLALIGGSFFAGFAVEFASGGDGKTDTTVYVIAIVLFGGMLAAGLYLIWHALIRPRPAASGAARPGTGQPQRQQTTTAPVPASDAERERRVLQLAEREHGRVTVPEVATHCELTLAEAKAELDRLVLLEVAELQVTPAGVLVYVFPGFLSDEEKARATDF